MMFVISSIKNAGIGRIITISILFILVYGFLQLFPYDPNDLYLNLCSEFLGIISIGAIWDWLNVRKENRLKQRVKKHTTMVLIECMKETSDIIDHLQRKSINHELHINRLKSCQRRLQVYWAISFDRINEQMLENISKLDFLIDRIILWCEKNPDVNTNRTLKRLLDVSKKIIDDAIKRESVE
ncbi:MAG: hypothetical protein ABIJ47_08085 [Candidatus Bathyarchaeota archaeon]